MFQRLQIYLCARRLKLRDKDQVKPVFIPRNERDMLQPGLPSFGEFIYGGKWMIASCRHCNEILRIGVKKDGGQAVKWCWRCERWSILDESQPIPDQDDDDTFLQEHGLRF